MAKFRRRLFSSGNFLATAILLGMLFILVNYISSRRYARWDLSRQKITALSDQTVRTLRSLKEPVSVIVFYQPAHRLYGFVNDLLKEYERVSPNIKVERVDPDQDIARAKQLAKEFQIENPNLVVFQSGSRHKYLSDAELADYDYSDLRTGGSPRVQSFKGEEAFTSAVISGTSTGGPLVWFISGHGEKPLESGEPMGISNLKKYLEQQNVAAQTVTLAEHASIPAEVKLAVIAGPTHRFTEIEITALQNYLEQGGRLLALIDPLEDTGLDGLLGKWGIVLGNDVVVDPSRQLPFVSAANLLVTSYTQHPIVEKMQTLVTLFPLVRSVRPAQPLPEGIIVTPLALTSEAGWGETQTSVQTFQFDEGQDLKGPVSIAVAAERQPATEAGHPATGGVADGSPEAAGRGARLVVIGDSDFIANSQLNNAGNRDFLLGATYWLIGEERLIGIGPKPVESIRLHLTGPQLNKLMWFSFLAMPLVCGMMGVGMWWVRRT